MSRVQKMELYEDFQCIGGQCGFTCCAGWDIKVDAGTYDKWKKHGQAGCFIDHLTVKHQYHEQEYFMQQGAEKRCPFLDDQGLCNIVCTYGEDYLPDTCRTFPRLENRFGELTELSLSCACPVVVKRIDRMEGYLSFPTVAMENISSMPPGYQLRNALLDLLQNRTYSFKNRILLGFQLLMDIKDETGLVDGACISRNGESISDGNLKLTADAELIEEYILKYKDPEYLRSLIDLWSGIEVEQTDSWLEVNELFLDICKNYRKEPMYQEYLQDIYEFAEILDTEEDTEPLESFRLVFGAYDRLMENCFTAKLFTGCISDDIDDMLLSYQMLVTEYVMIRYTSFLRFLVYDKKAKGSSISSGTVVDDIACFSRIIGYNADGMREFWEESFDDAIWELGYLILLIS